MTRFNKCIIFLRKNVKYINNAVPWFLMVYFTLICFPYIFARATFLNSIFTNSIIAFVFRFGLLFLYSLYGIIIMISNKIKPQPVIIIALSLLLFFFVVNAVVSPSIIISYSFFFTGKISPYLYNVGIFSHLLAIGRFLGDLLFFFFLFSSFPFVFKNKNQFTYVLLPVIAIAFLSIVYSLIFERSAIETVLTGGNPESVKSIFHSKNAYGIFLFNGAAAITFIFFSDSRKWTKFFAILLPVFLVMAFVINCKLAAICILVLFVLSYAYAVFRYFKTRPYISYSLLVISIVTSLGLLLIFIVPSLHSNGFLAKVYDKAVSSISDFDVRSFLGRIDEWSVVPRMTKGIYRWIGFSNAVGYQFIIAYTGINGTTHSGLYDLHNAYIDFYAYHGIIGCIIYGLLFVYLFYLVYVLFKKSKAISILVLIIFIVSIIFGMAETYRLFLSMSANTFALNIIIVSSLLFETKNEKNIWTLRALSLRKTKNE